ncbi:MAG: AAA family ATPase [Candidatus Accumulibacter sp. UW25]
MTNNDTQRKITLPKIFRVALENFDLYTHQPDVEVKIEKKVFCLIGANGLGKSTFLNTINFIITGAVPDPSRKFQSAQDYYRNASRLDRTEGYFTGRISEASRPIARATVELSWPSANITVTRDIFDSGNVSCLIITDTVLGTTQKHSISEDMDGDTLGVLYEKQVLHLCGLEDFAQFVFLFHFVATFDEGRHLLMWDDGALTNALYLAFGADPAAAKVADKLQRDMDRESSRGRNVRFSARHVTDRIKQLMDILKGEDTYDYVSREELLARHNNLLARHRLAEERVRGKQNELRDTDLLWTDLSASLTKLQLEYRQVFSERLQKLSTIEHHPIIRTSLTEDQCAICGTTHTAIVLKAKLTRNECPLCDSPVEKSAADDDVITNLRKLDSEIIRVRDELATVLKTRERVNAEVSAADAAEVADHDALRKFENEESADLVKSNAGTSFSVIRDEIVKLENERSEFVVQSENHYKKRDEIRERLRVYERELKKQYEAGAQNFVPRFRELAEEFIGLQIDVELEHRRGANDSGFGLRLRMDEKVRSSPDKVSESQRFFIDIALRMALTEFMSNSPAILLIDTPEGSLDIAYEARAGAMFSKFVADDNAIVMTANIRSSQLVLRLAQLQHEEGMQVVRMTDWTDLSEVQQTEEKLFLEAYDAIDAALQ